MSENQAINKDQTGEVTACKQGLRLMKLENRVKTQHQQKIKQLQKELVECSLSNGQKHRINPLLAEIKKLRSLIMFTGKKNQTSC